MLFNSTEFILFLPLVLLVYLATRSSVLWRNVGLLIASYVFYGWWDYRFLSLLLISTVVDYFLANGIHKAKRQSTRRLLLLCSILTNLGILASFKYADFFITSTTRALSAVGLSADIPLLHIVLPVGISFYTFQTLSYTIDVYRGRIEATTKFIDFALYVAFFPQLVAGPIERASSLLPQISSRRYVTANDVGVGSWLIQFGYFKKVVVADNLSVLVTPVFANHTEYSGLEILLAVVAFAFQIYGDFSGYSDIARGIARCLGFHIMVNFRLPYFALSPSDFWQRWHISLSSWLRDYLYISLGGNRTSRRAVYRNLMITMLLGGLWHGAAWNFVAWGWFHGLILVLYRWGSPIIRPVGERCLPKYLSIGLQWTLMTILTLIGWLLFRASSLTVAWEMLCAIDFSTSSQTMGMASRLILFAVPIILFDVWSHRTGDLLAPLQLRPALRTMLCLVLFATIVLLGFQGASQFLYFQF